MKEMPIPQDILNLVVERLPLKALHKFKAVSSSWLPLIQRNLRPPLCLDFFYRIHAYTSSNNTTTATAGADNIFRYIETDGVHNSSIDPTLSFFPLVAGRRLSGALHGRPRLPGRRRPGRLDDLRVLDCCNGLLLCFSQYNSQYFVCNPLTKSWTRFEDIEEDSLLDFDPQVSLDVRVIFFRAGEDGWMGIWANSPTMDRPRRYKYFNFRKDFNTFNDQLMSNNHHRAFWKGSLYLILGSNSEDFGDDGKIMRFRLLNKKRDDDERYKVRRQLIQLPKRTKRPNRVGIGRMRDKLCLAGLDWASNASNNMPRARLRVWSLSATDQTVMLLEHDSIISSSNVVLSTYDEKSPYIGSFHPSLDIVFILCEGMVYAYDLKTLCLNVVCRIGPCRWLVDQASIFPYSPTPVQF